MIGIASLSIDLQIIGSQDDIAAITANVAEVVAKQCFPALHKRILKADITDIELTDDDVDVIKMLATRTEAIITT